MSSRPLPEPSELTEEFWAAARRRELVRPVCDACGRSHFTPQVCCPHCLSEDWTYVASSGRGVVYSSTVAHRGAQPGFETPYQLAIVDFEDEGWSMLANLVERELVDIGTPVAVDWVDAAEGWTFPVFAGVAA